MEFRIRSQRNIENLDAFAFERTQTLVASGEKYDFAREKDDLNCAVFFGLIDFYGKLLYMTGKHEQGNQVGDCHKSVEGIGDIPKQS